MPGPKVSVVVVTRDRLPALRSCVASLHPDGSTGEDETLVVDDASLDETGAYLAAEAAAGRLVALASQGRGAAAARNVGLRHAQAEIVAATDDDCQVLPGWAARLARRLEATGAVAVGGRVVAAPDASLPSRLSQAITNGFVAALNPDPSDAVFLTSNNVAYRAGAVRDAGFFDEVFTGAGAEERELHARLRARGGRLVYASDIVVTHHAAWGWGGFWRQQMAYGRGARLFYRRASVLGAAAPRPLSVRTYLAAFRAALRELAWFERPALVLAFALSQLGILIGYVTSPASSLPSPEPDATVPRRG